MSKFKIGDKVIRIIASDWPDDYGKLGQEYTIDRYADNDPNCYMIHLKELPNKGAAYQSCFELSNTINQPNQLQPRKGYTYIQNRAQRKQDLMEDFQEYKIMYNLSQDEINQIIKEIEEEQKQLTLPGNAGNWTITTNVPNNQVYGFDPAFPKQSPTYQPKEKKECQHEWKQYTGLFQVDTYCTKCPAKK